MNKPYTLKRAFQLLAFLVTSSLMAQHALPKGVSSLNFSPQSSIPAFLKFEENAGPAVAEFFSYLQSNYPVSKDITWKEIQNDKDQLGFSNVRYVELVNGIPVNGSMLILHAKNGRVQSFNGETYTENLPGRIPTEVDEEQALNSALKYVGAKTYKWQLPSEEAFIKKEQNNPRATFFPKAELFYIKSGKNELSLACRFDIYAQEPMSRKYVFVRASDNKVISSEDRIHETEVTGSAVTAYSGTQTIQTDYTGTNYRLRETSRGLGIETYNLQKGTTYGSAIDFTDTDNIWNNVNANEDQYATDAHFGAEKTYDFYLNKYGRNSIDNAGFKLVSYVHYSTNYVNAYWDGTRMTYGDGDATYNPLTSMDISGHEITHGLTEKTANLTYSYQSGALNESFSDIFGTAIEFYATPSLADWLIGEDIGGAFRSMSNPNLYGQPDTYLGTNWYAGTGDNGGVHYNSGVQNYWFYLLSMGGSGTNDNGNAFSVSGIGIDKAASIAYRCLTTYLTPGSQYADARTYSIQAAIDLYGTCSAEVIATTAAWYAVGVGANTFLTNPTISYSGSTSLCEGNSITLNSNSLTNYQWNLNGQAISGATNASYTASAAGSYTISTVVCSTTYTSTPVVVSISTAAVSVSAPTTNSCDPIVLTANASPGYAIQWTLDGIDIPGATQINYTATESGVYAARISSTIGPASTLINSTATSIADNSCPGATSTIIASGLPSAMNPAGISVKINITHTWDADLKIWLEAPNGDLLGLANAVGSSGDNFTNTVFSDAGSAQIPASGAPYTGTYKPWATTFTNCSATTNRFTFASLGGGSINPNGTWKLRVTDNASQDLGSITNWSITFPQTITPSPDCGPVTSNPIEIGINSLTSYYVDADFDGVGSEAIQLVCSNTAPAGFSTTTGDCNDNDAGIQSPITYYVDADNDGYAVFIPALLCSSTAPAGFSSVLGDCNDANSAIYPGAAEICGNGIDDNCNGSTDELCTPYTFYADADNDGAGDASNSIVIYVNQAPAGYVAVAGDCNDNDSGIQSPITYYVDADNDGYAVFIPALLCSSTAPAGFSSVLGDCNDANAAINPGAAEICGNGIDDNCNGSTDENGSALGALTAINGPAGVCKSQAGVVFSVDALIGATNYTWTVPAGATLVSGQGTTSITVNFSSTQAAGNICVTASGACSSTAQLCRNLVVYTVKPVTPGAISGSNLENCQNTTRTFSIAPVANATSYTWTAPTNATVISGQGTTSATISFGASFTSGTLYVKASNCIGTSSNKSMAIYSKPGTPSSIAGALNGVCGGSTGTYTCPAVSGATSYVWTVPAGWTINSGQGTNSISLTAPASYVSAAIAVAASSACGTSTNRTITVRSVPAIPGTITGPTNTVCSGGSYTYSIVNVTGATSYTWTVPAGWSINSGQGTNTVNITPAAYTTASISVVSVNACGNSTPKSLALRSTPTTPGTISGLVNNVCGAGPFTYTIAPVANATSYNWTVPAGCNIQSNDGTSMTMTTTAAFTSGNVTVAAVNACGAGTVRTLTVSKNPATPAVITGTASICANQQGVAYSTIALAGLTYTWTVPSGASIVSGQGTSSIVVNFGANAGSVTVKANNACGTSSTRTFTVTKVACRISADGTEISDVPAVDVFPNPGQGVYTLRLNGMTDASKVSIYSMTGQLVQQFNISAGTTQQSISLENEADGIYLLRFETAGFVEEVKVIKN